MMREIVKARHVLLEFNGRDVLNISELSVAENERIGLVGANGSGQGEKDWLVALLLCLFLGGIGAHRFYAGKVGSGILYILTAGVFGIGILVDLIKIITGKFTDKDGNPIQKK